jgi:hypothetical protein
MRQWLSAITIFGTYSSRYCFGFSPNFLFTPSLRLTALRGTFTSAKVGRDFEKTSNEAKK